MSEFKFEELSERAKANVFDFSLNGDQIAKLSADIGDVPKREPDKDGQRR
jgi:hypothetical protein